MCFTSDVVRYGHGIPLKAAAGLLRRPETTDERRSSHFVCLLNRLVNSSSKRERGLLVGARERERGRERESFIHWTKSISDSAGTPATGSNASAPAPNQRQGTSQRHWKVNEGKLHFEKKKRPKPELYGELGWLDVVDRHLEGFVVTPALRLGRPAVEGAYQRLVARAAAHRQEHGGRRHEREREDGQTGLSVQRREETKTKKKTIENSTHSPLSFLGPLIGRWTR